MVTAKSAWVPDRQDIIWIDCNPQVSREMRDLHPFLVLSPKAFNKRTSPVIGLPMTTAEYNDSNPFAVVAGTSKAGKTSYILCHQPESFDWVLSSAKPHADKKVPAPVLSQALMVLNQIVKISEA